MRILRQFRKGQAGAAKVEYAMVLGAVLAALLFVTDSLTLAIRRPLSRLASDSNVAAWPADSHGRSSHARPVSVVVGESVEEELSQHHWGAVRFLLLTLLGIVTVIGYRSLRRERRASAEREQELRAAQQEASQKRSVRFVRKRQQLLRIMSGHPEILLEGRMLVKHLMTDEVVAACPSASAPELLNTMAREEVRHVMVCGKKGELLGIVSERDLRASSDKRAKDLMTNPSTKVPLDMPIKSAVTIMFEQHLSSLPVVEDGQLKGILTTTDLSLALQCAIQLLESQMPPHANGANQEPVAVPIFDPEESFA